ncbi:MAG: YceI family protein [Alphaproteobacteria bacterium]|nr:YceI family protein [Alphaproteobacteria bacterium]
MQNLPRKLALIFLMMGTLATPAIAQTSLNVPPATYNIDPKHTQIIFSIRHMGLSTFYGRFGQISGSLTFDPATPEKSALTVQIDMKSLSMHVPKLDEELMADVFHADKFPTATFVATQSTKTGANTGTVTGNLTIAGVTKPVTLKVTFNGGRNSPFPLQPYRVGFDATATVKRSDFGLTKMMWSGLVGDDVALMIQCELEKK